MYGKNITTLLITDICLTLLIGTVEYIYLAESLDYESCSSINISVTVYDGHVTSDAAYLNIVIDDVNEAPRFLSNEYVINTTEQSVVLLEYFNCRILLIQLAMF